jgi:hypothetical protein
MPTHEQLYRTHAHPKPMGMGMGTQCRALLVTIPMGLIRLKQIGSQHVTLKELS